MSEQILLKGISTPGLRLSTGASPESPSATADRDFRAIFLREMLRPVTQKLWKSSSLGGGSGAAGAGVYQFFMEEALASKLAEAWPLPTVIPEAGNAPPNAQEPRRAAIPVEKRTFEDRRVKIPKLPESLITRAARTFDLPRNLIRAVVLAESGGRADAVSSKGAQGLMQLMPGTAKEMGIANPLDAWQNLYAGTRYLSRQLSRFGDLPRALAAYNAGPATVERHRGVPPFPETKRYIETVLVWKSRLDTAGE